MTNRYKIVFSAVLFFLISVNFSFCVLQKYAVKGRLFCGAKPANNIKVKLVDIDTGGTDDVLDEKLTDNQGNFQVQGQTSELTDIDPMLKIYHNCLDTVAVRFRRWRMNMPKKYIGKGANSVPTVVDVGQINLEPEILAEDRNF